MGICALLYAPIAISIMKIKHLPSVRENEPHKYVFWQLLSLVIFKIINFPMIFLLTSDDIVKILYVQKVMDAYSTPLIMVLSYLGCNKRTFVEFLKSFGLKSLLKKLACPFRTSTRVEDSGHVESTESAVP